MSVLTGTRPLLRTLLKHEARSYAPWILIVTLLSVSSVIIYPITFSQPQDRAQLAALVGSNPALGLIFGPAYDLMTTDGFNAWRSLALGGFLTALGAIFAVTKATRGQEDSGQAELLASGVLGRSSRLMSAVMMAVIGSIAVGVIAGALTVAFGGGLQTSLLLCSTFVITGWMFAGVAAVTSQIGSDAKSATSMAVAVLGALFVLRGFAYSTELEGAAIWANPLAWMTETKPSQTNNWWPLALGVALSIVLLIVAFALQARRDFGQGFVATKPGPDRGLAGSSPRLVLRLQRGSLIAWGLAFVALGVVFGYFATSIQDVLSGNSAVAQVLASGASSQETLINAFIVMILSLVGIIASISGVQTVLRLRSEELDDRVEPVIAAGARREALMASYVGIALGATSIYVLIAATIIGLFANSANVGVSFGDVFLQGVATLPAVWLLVTLPGAVLGLKPHLKMASWAGVLVSFMLTLLGPTFGLDDWVLSISPFRHVPVMAIESRTFGGIIVVTLIAVALFVAGIRGFRNRDLAR